MEERKTLFSNYKLSIGSSVLLDLIRGVSAQLVVVGHALSVFGVFRVLHPPTTPWMQEIAVLIFFLLSVFLISYSTSRKMLRNPDYDFGYFFIDRFSRIYTAFIPSLIFVLAIDTVSIYLDSDAYAYHDAFNPITFLVNLLQLQDFPILKISSYLNITPAGMTTSFGSARPFWTLAVEWWIYMFFGYFMIVFISQKKLSLSRLIILGFLSIVPVFNLIEGRGHGLMMYWLFGAIIYVISTYNFLSSISRYVKQLLIFILLVCAILRGAILQEEYDPILAFILVSILWLLIDFYKEKKFSVGSTQYCQICG